MTDVNVENIKSTLQESIQQFRDLNPEKHSYAYIGMKTNNSTSFVERAAKNRLGIPLDPKKVLPLAKLVCYEPETRKVAKFFASSVIDQSDILKDALYAKFVEDNETKLSEELETKLLEDENFLAYALSCAKNGTTESRVRNIGGNQAVNSLIDLTNRGYIQHINNNYRATKNIFSYSFKTMKKIVGDLIRFYKPDNVGKGRNFIHVVTYDLNKEGLLKLQEEHRRHYENILKIRNDYHGNITTFTCGFMDVFTNEDIEMNEKSTIPSSKLPLILIACLTSSLISLFSAKNTYAIDEVRQFTTVDEERLYIQRIKHIDLELLSNTILLDNLKMQSGETIYAGDITQKEFLRVLAELNISYSDLLGKVDPGKGGGVGGGGRITNPYYREITLYFNNVGNGGGASGGGRIADIDHHGFLIKYLENRDHNIYLDKSDSAVPEQNNQYSLPNFIQKNL